MFDAFRCGGPARATRPGSYAVLCLRGVKYLLAPATWSGRVASTGADRGYSSDDWLVNISLDAAGTATFARLSRKLYDSGGRLALLVDRRMLSFGSVNEPISTGQLQVSGLSQKEALALVDELT